MDSQISLRRALQITDLLSKSPEGEPFSRIQQELGDIGPTAVSRLLKVLAEESWLSRGSDRKYRLSERFTRAASTWNNRQSFPNRAAAFVRQAAQETGHSATWVEYHRGAFYHRYKAEIAESMHYMDENTPNRNFHINGLGQLVLAYQPSDEIVRVVSELGIEQIQGESPAAWLEKIEQEQKLISKEPGRIRLVLPIFDKDEFAGAAGITIIGAHPDESDHEKTLVRLQEIAAKYKLTKGRKQ